VVDAARLDPHPEAMRSKSLAFLLAAVGCGAGTDPNTADVSGRWTFTETLEDRAHGITCADTGTYEITQMGDRFSGLYGQSGVCYIPGGAVDNADSGTVQGGHVIGRTIRFMVDATCEYEASVTGVPATQLSGHGTCVLQDANRILLGTWQATR
jgi:hypothetical protein